MNLQHGARILVLGPHTDDGELGCGGMMAGRIRRGHDIRYAVFSRCQRSVPDGLPKDVLVREVQAACVELGLDPARDLTLFDYDVRSFPAHRQQILEDLIRLRDSYKPDVVFCPSLSDIHQDHSTVAQEALRAFKRQTILCYEEPWNNINFSTQAFERLAEEDLGRKLKALACYRSQRHRPYFNEETTRAMAVMRGSQLEGGYAEAFEVVRYML